MQGIPEDVKGIGWAQGLFTQSFYIGLETLKV